MNIRHLRFFVELAKTEHMAKAAETLGISQPSLSYAISSIENELGVPLFEKEGRNIRLTNYGKIYLKYVKSSLDELDRGGEFISELLDVNRGHIRIGFTFTMGQDLIPELISQFRKEDSSAGITFDYSQDTTEELVKRLLNDDLDLVISSMPTTPGEIEKISAAHLVDQEMFAAVPNSHPLAQKSAVSLADLAKYPMIYYSKQSGLRQRLDDMFQSAGVTPQIAMEAVEDHTIIGFVHWGFGVAVIPHLPQLDPRVVTVLPIKDEVNTHPIYVLKKVDHFLTPAVTKFEQFISSYCHKHYISEDKMV
ncbi:LysR family transcriptional regulator [Lactobacillus porci]|uniref:LysR family transcriptional regulator n=1 Tax=Lactobacillus porci TaxID=2012477 RepID=A0A6A8MEQ1_9LACO|nr:LysR family transcriptional regulator [Lactobacillus porci]MST87288.1 LysR family transcriptional regulator [Lactobacillus porci]